MNNAFKVMSEFFANGLGIGEVATLELQ